MTNIENVSWVNIRSKVLDVGFGHISFPLYWALPKDYLDFLGY